MSTSFVKQNCFKLPQFPSKKHTIRYTPEKTRTESWAFYRKALGAATSEVDNQWENASEPRESNPKKLGNDAQSRKTVEPEKWTAKIIVLRLHNLWPITGGSARKGYLFQASGMARDEVGISLLKVYERVEKFVIFIRWLGKSREKILFLWFVDRLFKRSSWHVFSRWKAQREYLKSFTHWQRMSSLYSPPRPFHFPYHSHLSFPLPTTQATFSFKVPRFLHGNPYTHITYSLFR